jgi:cell surface protein SprA
MIYFSLLPKHCLGARGIYEFSKKTKLGFSVLNLNQQTLSDKVRIGEEPLSNSIYGLDFTHLLIYQLLPNYWIMFFLPEKCLHLL